MPIFHSRLRLKNECTINSVSGPLTLLPLMEMISYITYTPPRIYIPSSPHLIFKPQYTANDWVPDVYRASLRNYEHSETRWQSESKMICDWMKNKTQGKFYYPQWDEKWCFLVQHNIETSQCIVKLETENRNWWIYVIAKLRLRAQIRKQDFSWFCSNRWLHPSLHWCVARSIHLH